MKKTSLVAWYLLIFGLAGLFLFVVLNKEQPPKEGCLECKQIYGMSLQEEIEIAEKALDEEIKKLNEKIARLKE